ncbi:MAG: hypothetical protein IKQ23_05460 [Treponema sp.]|nr:hypothetical protein [Treponema sp.]
MENTDKNSMEKIVRSLVGQYGKELYLPENELRFKGLLFDFASDFANELKTLKVALSERIPAKLLACDDKDDDEKSRTLHHCKDTLVDDVGLMEERVVQVLNVLTEGLGWNVRLDVKTETPNENSLTKTDAKPTASVVKTRKVDYNKLVAEVLSRFPLYRTRYKVDFWNSHPEVADIVNIGHSGDVDATKFWEVLRERLYVSDNFGLNDDLKKILDKYLRKISLHPEDLYLMIGGKYGSIFSVMDFSFVVVILINEINPVSYKCIAGSQERYDHIYTHLSGRLMKK